MQVPWELWEVTVNIIEITIIYIFYNIVLSNWKQSRPKTAIGAVCLVVYISSINLLSDFDGLETTLFSLAGFLVYVLLAYKGSIKIRIFYAFVPIIITMTSDFLTVTLATLFSDLNPNEYFTSGPVRFSVQLLYLVCCAILYLLAVLIHKRVQKQKELSYPFLFFAIFLLVLEVIVINFLMDISIVAHENGLGAATDLPIMFIGLVFIVFFLSLVIFFFWWNILLKKQYVMEMKMQHRRMMEDYLVTVEQSANKMEKAKHDMMNHMDVVKTLIDDGQTGEASEYLAHHYGVLDKKIILTHYTCDAMVNALLANKKELAYDRNIETRYSVEKVDRFPICSSDMCSILGNLLDNAIESCERAYNQEDLFIDLFIRIENNALNIIIKNRCYGYLMIEDGQIKSKKNRPGHGKGLKIVKEILSEVEGNLEYSFNQDDCIFKVVVFIPY